MSESYRYYWEDFPIGLVREFGGVTVSREDIVRFAREFDPQPFHVDEDAARDGPFGGLVASGWQTCGLAMRMICDAYLLDTASAGSPGVEQVRWLKPVRPGDTLRMRTVVLDARPLQSKPGMGLVRTRWETMNQEGDEVMQMEALSIFLRRPR